MNLLAQIILVCLVLAALQGLVAVLIIAIVLSLVWGLFFRTEQTVGLAATCLLLSALQVHPWLTIGAAAVLGAVLLIARPKDRGEATDAPPIALPPPDDRPG